MTGRSNDPPGNSTAPAWGTGAGATQLAVEAEIDIAGIETEEPHTHSVTSVKKGSVIDVLIQSTLDELATHRHGAFRCEHLGAKPGVTYVCCQHSHLGLLCADCLSDHEPRDSTSCAICEVPEVGTCVAVVTLPPIWTRGLSDDLLRQTRSHAAAVVGIDLCWVCMWSTP